MIKVKILESGSTIGPSKRRKVSREQVQAEHMEKTLNSTNEDMLDAGFVFIGMDIISEDENGSIKFVAFYEKA